jgi:hypothetical protein
MPFLLAHAPYIVLHTCCTKNSHADPSRSILGGPGSRQQQFSPASAAGWPSRRWAVARCESALATMMWHMLMVLVVHMVLTPGECMQPGA